MYSTGGGAFVLPICIFVYLSICPFIFTLERVESAASPPQCNFNRKKEDEKKTQEMKMMSASSLSTQQVAKRSVHLKAYNFPQFYIGVQPDQSHKSED